MRNRIIAGAISLAGLVASIAIITHADAIAYEAEYRFTRAQYEAKLRAIDHNERMRDMRWHYAHIYGVR